MMQAQYRNYPQATPGRPPHATPNRRGPGPMVAPPGQHAQVASQQQLQIQQQQEAQRRELGKRLAKRPTDKNMPDGIEDAVIGNGAEDYRKLREAERRLDSIMMRKRLDVQDSVNRNMTRYRTMRIWISNTAENQPWQQTTMDADAFDFNSENNATYRVKIEGKLVPEDDDLDSEESEGNKGKDGDAMDHGEDAAKKTEAKAQKSSTQRTKLSHFFKSITIDFDRSKTLQPDGFTQIEWKKAEGNNASNEANFDCLEFERKSDENINVTVNLLRDDQPERYRLSKPLANLIDTEEEDRAGVMMGVWNYIKAMNLEEEEDTRRIRCDDRLRAVFGTDTIFFPHLPQLIMPHLQALPPLQLPYTIRVDKPYISPDSTTSDDSTPSKPSPPTIYDVLVPIHDPLREAFLLSSRSPTFTNTLTTIAGYDEQLCLTIQAIAHSKAKHAFFTSLARDPIGFTRRWTSSQRRDLEVILGEATRGGGEEGQGEEWRRGGEEGVWGSENARESVGLWLARGKAH